MQATVSLFASGESTYLLLVNRSPNKGQTINLTFSPLYEVIQITPNINSGSLVETRIPSTSMTWQMEAGGYILLRWKLKG